MTTTTLSAAMSSSTLISLCNDESTYVSLCFLSTAVRFLCVLDNVTIQLSAMKAYFYVFLCVRVEEEKFAIPISYLDMNPFASGMSHSSHSVKLSGPIKLALSTLLPDVANP
ncbi:hypothetical protein D5086_009254 [Populus alba]|uniref:Uncharacterized protein n=1 Tax=Populus alba TaxID=43335 RepID=A0ACC4CIA2_POPAL